MTATTRLTLIVEAEDDILFELVLHRSSTEAARLIEPGFYEKYSGGVFGGDHYELELMEPPVWEHPNSGAIHFHTTPSGRQFVCWTGRLPALEDARRIAKMWCVGTAFTMMSGGDFAPLYTGDTEQFLELMRAKHRVKCIACTSGEEEAAPD